MVNLNKNMLMSSSEEVPRFGQCFKASDIAGPPCVLQQIFGVYSIGN